VGIGKRKKAENRMQKAKVMNHTCSAENLKRLVICPIFCCKNLPMQKREVMDLTV